jgi:2-polyprenyl-3-methyl-5-hydroxy-6-metoxy-1,4-benzoquinol methylase
MPMWQFDQTLLDNTNISFIQSNIEEYLLEKNNGFDLILLINVIAFIKKENFLSDILIKITNSVNPQ